MKIIYFKILFISIILAIIFTENISTIQISGNVKTNDTLILNYIQHPAGIPFQANIAEIDMERLEKLDIFDSIEINNKDDIYFINVKEKKTALYSPLIDKTDGLGWSIGANIDINNIKGTLNNANLTFTFGAINTQSFKYKHKIFSIEYINNQLESIESDYLRNESNIFLTYNLKNNFYIKVGTQKNTLDYETNQLLEYNYLNSSINFSKVTEDSFFKTYFSFRSSLNNGTPDYSKFFIKYDNNITISSNNISSIVLFRTQVVLNTCPENFLMDFENLYLGGDNYVRGYHPNPSRNPSEISGDLKFRNMIFQSVQLEIPMMVNKYFNSNFLLFNDFAIGSNNYKNFNHNNKIKGFGFGIAITTMYQMRFDICVGLNHHGKYQMHFMKNINF